MATKRKSLTDQLARTEIQPEPSSDSITKPRKATRTTEPKPSRRNTKALGGHFDPAVVKQFKQIGLDEDKTNQTLLEEALNLLFEKYGKDQIA